MAVVWFFNDIERMYGIEKCSAISMLRWQEDCRFCEPSLSASVSKAFFCYNYDCRIAGVV